MNIVNLWPNKWFDLIWFDLIFEKLLDFLDSYEVINQGEYPPLPKLVDFIYKFRTEIDAHVAKTYKGSKYNFAQTNASYDEIETGGNKQISRMTFPVC